MGRKASLAALEEGFTEPSRDPLWKHIYLTKGLKALVESPPFRRLGRILQLGPAYLTYPGATHSRAAHSLGVYHLASRMARSLVERGMGGALSPEGLRGLQVAALCHDLGHFPFAHSLKEQALRDHESLSAELMTEEPLRSLIAEAGADPAFAASIVDRAGGEGDAELSLYRAILSGVLDPDKLDYLSRDAYYCGVPYGVQDVDFVLDRMAVDEKGRLGIDERGVMSVEAVLFSKYLMYRSVYWHRSVRASTAAVKKATGMALSLGLPPESLYRLDDSGFRALAAARFGEAASLVSRALEGPAFHLLYERAFDPLDALHQGFLPLGKRLAMEERLASRLGLSPLELVADIPEPVSFESDMPVLGLDLPFNRSSTVFRPDVVSSFARSLRVFRVFGPRPFAAHEVEEAMDSLR